MLTPKEQAEKMYKEAYQRWCFELSHDKNHLAAKAMVEWAIKYILSDMGADRGYAWWEEVLEELKSVRG
jgi:hypothetical protein